MPVNTKRRDRIAAEYQKLVTLGHPASVPTYLAAVARVNEREQHRAGGERS